MTKPAMLFSTVTLESFNTFKGALRYLRFVLYFWIWSAVLRYAQDCVGERLQRNTQFEFLSSNGERIETSMLSCSNKAYSLEIQ